MYKLFIQLFLITFLAPIISVGQQPSVVKDSLTNQPIPFVNIWLENESIGTTSNEQGEYFFKTDLRSKTLVFSSIGYKEKKITSKNDTQTVFLLPESIEMKEVIILGKRKSSTKQIGDLEKTTPKHFFVCDGQPYMLGKYFLFNEKQIKSTPFLKKVEIYTASQIEGATFNLRFFTMNNNGMPDKSLYWENIIVPVRKGNIITAVELDKMNIQIPATGMLIAVEFLITNQNRFTLSSKTDEVTFFAPAFGTIPVKESKRWIYSGGKWQKAQKRDYENRYSELAISVTTTN